MINDQILNYVKQQLALGSSKELISSNLKTQGWTDLDIVQVFSTINPIVPQIHKSKKTVILSVALILIFCLIGGGVYAYYSGLFLSLPSLTSKAIYNIKNINSATYDTTIKVDFSEMKDMSSQVGLLFTEGITPTEFDLTTKGSYDFSDINNRKISSLFSAESGLFSGGVEILMTDNIFYGKITKAPTVAIFSMITEFENKWFSFPLKSEKSESLNPTFNPIIEMSGIDPDVVNKITQEQKEQLYNITKNAHLTKIVKRLPLESINGELSYHFTFDLDRQGITEYLVSVKEYINTIGKNDSTLSSFDPTSFSKKLDNLGDFKGEIWIGRKDTLPYKIIVSFTIKPNKDKDEKIKINIVNIFKGFNKPVSIVAPDTSSSFEEFISGVVGGETTEDKISPVTAITSDVLNARIYGEIFYDGHNSYSGFCSSSELKNQKKVILDAGGSEFFCKDSKETYAVSIKLPTELGYFCVDSTGLGKKTNKQPTDTVCPQ